MALRGRAFSPGLNNMINEELTFQKFGYYAKDLKPKSNKKIIAVCDGCSKTRELAKQDYFRTSFCKSCGSKGKNKGRKFTKEHREKISLAKENVSFSEEHKKKISLSKKGVQHKDYKGIAPLALLIRNLVEYSVWRKGVFQRDNHTCQECNQRGGSLEAHHKKEFALIFHEFLREYNQFSPIEDKETLIRLAMRYQPFWDLSNGKTLCLKCHYLIRHFEVEFK